MIASQERTIAKMDAWLAEMKDCRKETTAWQEATDTCLDSQESTSLEVESDTEHEVPKEEATVKPVGVLR
jgi:hypothetical protein